MESDVRPQTLGYAVLRLAIGISMLIHGVVRFPKIPTFAAQTVKMFAGSPLPPAVVGAFARLTPFVEFAIGLSVILGLATKSGLTLGGLWMVLLIFGSTLIEKYDIVGIQLLYSLVFFHLLIHHEHNAFSLDALILPLRSRRGIGRSKLN
ncbi:MAG TPA: DoxX family protein [Tepidisphaeraceae bacterium]|jgi:thiosulfate dehydrogenase [quinone] large subunit